VPDPHEPEQSADETQWPSVVFSVTPEQLRPFPRVPPTATMGRRVKQRGKTRILTETPEKEELKKNGEK
jgi:hypothetical protein